MILLLSGYDAGSHRRWHRGLKAHLKSLGHDVHVETMPPRHFRWRVRGNPIHLAYQRPELWKKPWDLIIATSAVDVATLRSLVPTSCPWIVYVHENQFAYPLRPGQRKRDGALLIRDLYTALAADHVVFNSNYNRISFVEGARAFLGQMPDFNQLPDGTLEDKSSIIPVPLDDPLFKRNAERDRSKSTPLRILWNHRWEWDKAPETFFMALRHATERGLDFRLNVVGQQFRTIPEPFERGREEFRDVIDRWGYQEAYADYLDAIDESHVVVSTSRHEFQGLAVLEAAARGCVPLLPDRLAYPEFFGDLYLYESTPDDPDQEARVLAERLVELGSSLPVTPDLLALGWKSLGPRWTALIKRWSEHPR